MIAPPKPRAPSNARMRSLSRWKARLRVGIYALAVTTAATLVTAQRARAHAGEMNLALGRELSPLAAEVGERGTQVTFNGQSAFVASAMVRERKDAILARFEARCLANPGLPGTAWQALAETHAPESHVSALRHLATVRRDGDGDGVVACFERGPATARGLDELRVAFERGVDLAALGLLRFVYVRERGPSSHVTIVWTDGSFRLDKLAPAPGEDGEGSDFEGLPRPAESLRRLSIRADATGFGVNLYEVQSEASVALDGYDAAMRQRGWTALAPTDVRAHGRAYVRDGAIVALDVQSDSPSRVMLSVSVLGAGQPSMAPFDLTP